jgi:hypothetical protein
VQAESRLAVQFPQIFRAYLLEIAKAPGVLFQGSDVAEITEFEKYRADALALMAKTDPTLALPPQAIVFLIHQGYQFVYIIGVGGFDTPPMFWTEGSREPTQLASSFAEMVDVQLSQMEKNNASFREDGGYYLTLHPEGGATQSFPARSGGDRPLDRG